VILLSALRKAIRRNSGELSALGEHRWKGAVHGHGFKIAEWN
jgi:hypothetical protein